MEPATVHSRLARANSHSATTATETRRGRGRPRASLACVNCRLRKVKCDVQNLPRCTTCTPCRSSGTKCIVDRHDGRRKDHVRGSIDRLQGRLAKLEALLTISNASLEHGSMQDALDDRDANNVAVVDDEPIDPAILPSPHQLPAIHESRAAGVQARRVEYSEASQGSEQGSEYRHRTSSLNIDYDPVLGAESDLNMLSSHSDDQHAAFANRHQRESRDTESMRHDIDQLQSLRAMSSTSSARLDQGSVTVPTEDSVSCLDVDQTGGQPRYYGPASRLYIHDSSHVVQEFVEPELESEFPIDIDSSQIQKQLLFLFWHVPVLPAAVVDETLFRAGRARRVRSQYYSQFVQDALLACASRASTSSTLRGLGEKYIERAKTQIAREIERPNLASLQGFLLLSDFEATQGRERAGWIYCGIACRLLYDLGLHEDCSGLVSRGRLTIEDAGMRQHCFIVTFIFEKFWKLYLGRPSSINEASLSAVRSSTQLAAIDPVVDAYLSLCVTVSSVTDLLNSSASTTSISDLKARVTELDAQIQSCYHDLPASLKDQGSNGAEMEPAAYGINMQFCGIRIVLHRVLGRFEDERSSAATIGTPNDTNASFPGSSEIIHQNAMEIAKLIHAYRKIFGVDRVATIMLDNMYVAAQALVQHSMRLEARNLPIANDLQSLRVLAATMRDVVPHYPVMARMRSSLARLVENTTSMRGLFGPYVGRQPEEPTPPLIEDFSLGAGSWNTVDSFFDFDLTDAGDMNVDAMFSGT